MLIENDRGGMTYVASIKCEGIDRRCDMLDSVRMLMDAYSDLAACVQRIHGDAMPNDLEIRLDLCRYMLARLRSGELKRLAKICNGSR